MFGTGGRTVSIVTFGNVTSGSLTAFLLDAYQNDAGSDHITAWIMFANTTLSLSVLLTYPLTMFSAIELMGPFLHRNACWTRFTGNGGDQADKEEEEVPMPAFDPLPPLPEHDAFQHSATEDEDERQHTYGAVDNADPLLLPRQNSSTALAEGEDAASAIPPRGDGRFGIFPLLCKVTRLSYEPCWYC